jgi:hypothetical protein
MFLENCHHPGVYVIHGISTETYECMLNVSDILKCPLREHKVHKLTSKQELL